MKTSVQNKTNKTYSKQKGQAKKKVKKKSTKKIKIVAIVFAIIFIGILLVLFLLSDLFNINKITVLNNSRVSTQEIIQRSGLEINKNMFKTLKSNIISNVKSSAYIENVKVHKKLNGEVIIEVEERVPTYMLYFEDKYVYINNQGYILEISENQLEVPLIKGYTTKDIIVGKRLGKEDLEKLDTVIQIMETANNKQIKQIITSIDITDKNNYILEIPSEKKTVQFGNNTNINVKILWIIEIMEKTKGEEGEIVVKGTDITKAYFREKV